MFQNLLNLVKSVAGLPDTSKTQPSPELNESPSLIVEENTASGMTAVATATVEPAPKTQLFDASKVDVEKIEAWLEALESGKLKQTKNALISEHRNSFCCLGVQCKVLGLKSQNRWGEGQGFVMPNDAFDTEMPTKEVLDVFGMQTIDKDLPLHASSYAELNDNGMKFKDIAAKLREDYKAVGILS